MKELSLHILDIVMNSVKAKSKLIEISIYESNMENLIKINIKDNGIGMDSETLKNVTNPFYTTRTTRKVGLGIPLLKEAAERSNGYFKIISRLNIGTEIECTFEKNNIDRAPIGNIGDTMMVLINSLEDCEMIYKHVINDKEFIFSTIQIKELLDGANIKDNNVIIWIKEYINENIKELYIDS